MKNIEVIKKANGRCESCGAEAPFVIDGIPYLEIIKLTDKSEMIDNMAAICPNCKTKIDKLGDKSIIEDIIKKRGLTLDESNNFYKKNIKRIIAESSEFQNEVKKNVKKLVKECSNANSEATVASRFETTLSDLLKWYGLDYKPIREEGVLQRTINNDVQRNTRLDSRFRNVITEYKKDLTVEDIESCINQLEGYILSLSENEKTHIDKYFGVLTDGRRILFISYVNGESYKSILHPLTDTTMIDLLKVYLSLERKELTPQKLVEDFQLTSEKSPSLKLVKALYNELSNEKHNEFEYDNDWEKLFKLGAHNENNMKAIKDRKIALANIFKISIKDIDETKALFTIHTAYVIIIKLIAFRVVTHVLLQDTKPLFNELSNLSSSDLRSRLIRLENGEIFRELGIRNLLEGDFFSWYLDSHIWNSSIHESISKCVEILSEYDTNRNLFQKNSSGDLFRNLYESMIPREVRHSLGEFYTEPWLADKTTIHSINILDKVNWRGIDVCAGSGTFVMKMIEKVLDEPILDNNEMLENILSRINAIDINPLAVLTCRVNYFIAISPLINMNYIAKKNELIIPVYLGDSALAPQIKEINNIECIQYDIVDDSEVIKFTLPKEVLLKLNIDEFERLVKLTRDDLAEKMLIDTVTEKSNYDEKVNLVQEFTRNIRYMLNKGFSNAWIKSIFSILKTRTIGKFDIIVSNPPWIDWKVLPDGYREILKKACIENYIFSGDKFTGGINLNICVLITNVAINTWLKDDGIMGVLMPKSIAFQQSYAGFRNLVTSEGKPINYIAFDDWTKAGHPFYPVTEKFLAYYFAKGGQKINTIPVIEYEKKKGVDIRDKHYENYKEIETKFNTAKKYAFIATEEYNNFTITADENKINEIKMIAGTSYYNGRVGLGIYPKDMLLFELEEEKTLQLNTNYKKLYLKRHSSTRTERQYSSVDVILERDYIYPVIESPNIVRFGLENIKYYAPFPYTKNDLKKPIDRECLKETAPMLVNYYEQNEAELTKTDYNKRLQGKKGEFYSMTRVGKYTFAPVRVIYRNNTKWVATVIENAKMPWNEEKMYLLLDHACSVSQRDDGSYIDLDEAHYICALMNSKIAEEYVLSSSDSRSFRTKFQLRIVKYESQNPIHVELSNLSKEAHGMNKLTKEFEERLELVVKKYLLEI
ncbi:Eco57I restriction-modification methylase domain-containing protein [Clostridium perfringens]|uniref:Eco57I restriction-modification methylase domain-containing protein n=1 Tax=Clostridium perfringens TaxID=1502 RepID=UPI0030D1CC04